jgi:hypothetical protein
MNKSVWIIASVSIIVGLGFGDAGCHTSGIPGGTGAGGVSGAGGVTGTGGHASSGADSGQDNDAGADAEDAGQIGSPCDNDLDCSDSQICDNMVCVDCLSDNDCLSTGKGKVCSNKTCLNCVADRGCDTAKRCFRNSCIDSLACSSSDRTACVRATPRMMCGLKGYCVQCMSDSDCEQYAPATCSSQQCTCDDEGGMCLIGGQPVNVGDTG